MNENKNKFLKFICFGCYTHTVFHFKHRCVSLSSSTLFIQTIYSLAKLQLNIFAFNLSTVLMNKHFTEFCSVMSMTFKMGKTTTIRKKFKKMKPLQQMQKTTDNFICLVMRELILENFNNFFLQLFKTLQRSIHQITYL